VQTFLSGSYKRDTAIRPRIKDGMVARPDVDIIAVTNYTLNDDPKDVINSVFSAIKRLKQQKDSYKSIRRQARSVGIETTTVDMDVVPIIAPFGLGNTLYIANRKYESEDEKWLVTNPPGHTTWTTEMNRGTKRRFKPLVKLFKWWRRQNPTIAKHPKGFILECIVAECMDTCIEDYGTLFLDMLDQIVAKYEVHVACQSVPLINDPSVPGNSVTSGLSFDAFSGFYNKVKAHAEVGMNIRFETDPSKETELWRAILGNRFPQANGSPGTNNLLQDAKAVSPFVFPDKPVVPKNPEGFA